MLDNFEKRNKIIKTIGLGFLILIMGYFLIKNIYNYVIRSNTSKVVNSYISYVNENIKTTNMPDGVYNVLEIPYFQKEHEDIKGLVAIKNNAIVGYDFKVKNYDVRTNKLNLKRGKKIFNVEIGYENPKDAYATLYEDGTLVIEGKGELAPWLREGDKYTLPWFGNNYVKTVLFERNIKPQNIEYFFNNLYDLEYVNYIPDSVEDMSFAFYNAFKLKNINKIPYSVKTANSSFEGCYNLKGSIDILANLKEYNDIFKSSAYMEDLKINYISSNSKYIEKYIATKSPKSKIVKGDIK